MSFTVSFEAILYYENLFPNPHAPTTHRRAQDVAFLLAADFVEFDLSSHENVQWKETGGDPRLLIYKDGRVYPYFLLGKSRKDINAILQEHGM